MKKILIVEDDAMLVEIYEKKFAKDGYEVITATSGSKAEKKIRSDKPDLVLLDLVLPEEDGFGVLERIKQDPSTKDTRVVVFSNLSQEEDKEKARKLGAEGFVTKSDFTPQEIVEEVKKYLKGSGSKEAKEDAKEEVMADESQEETGSEGGKKILLMEDEEVFAEVFGKKLTENGYHVETVKNGAWGVKKSEEKKYDLMLIDIVMPAMDGVEVVKKIKEGEKNRETPMIIFSNSVNEDERRKEILEIGVDSFLVKTKITPSELAEEVDKIIG